MELSTLKRGVRVAILVLTALTATLTILVIATQAGVLRSVDILHDPKLVWTNASVHQHYLQMSRFRASPVRMRIGGRSRSSTSFECRRPAYFLVWDGEFINTSPVTNCSEGTIEAEGWTGFGERFRVLTERKESIGNTRVAVPVNLAFRDGRSILNETLVEVRTNSGERVQVNLDANSAEECGASYRGGQLSLKSNSSCARIPVRAFHLSIGDSPTHNQFSATIAACSDGSFRVLASGPGAWRSVTGSVKSVADFADVCNSAASTPLPCDESATWTRKVFRLSSMANGLSVACSSRKRVPETDVERLAAFSAEEGGRVSRSKARLITSFDPQLENALNARPGTGIGLPVGMEVVVLNGLTGEIVGMASRRDESADISAHMPVANFALRAPGSVAKIPFAFASLESTKEPGERQSALERLVLHNVAPDGHVGRNSVSCRVANGEIPGCRDSSDFAGSYPTHGQGNYDFHRFLVESENQYAVALTYLASSINISPFITCNNRFSFVESSESAKWRMSFDGEFAPLKNWLRLRTPVVNDTGAPQCAVTPELPWLRFMRDRFGVAEPRRGNRRAEIWGGGELSSQLVGISPEREHFGLARTGVEGATILANGYVRSQIYKIPFGSGEGLWSNIGIVAAATDVVLGLGGGAQILPRDMPLMREPLTQSAKAIVAALAGVVTEKAGTAHSVLCSGPVNCSRQTATINVPGLGAVEVIAKTGTPTARPATVLPARAGRAFERLSFDNDFVSQCDQDCKQLTAIGEEKFQRIWTAFEGSPASRVAGLNGQVVLRGEYLSWLRDRIFANVEVADSGLTGDAASEKRLLVILRRAEDPRACALYITSRSGSLAAVGKYMHQLMSATSIHRACGFAPPF